MRPRVIVLAGATTLALWAAARARPVALDTTGRAAVAVEVATAQVVDMTASVEVVGALAPKISAHIKSEYSGIVAAVHVREWVAVRKDQPLATLDAREAKATLESARAALLQATVAETRAVRERQRATKLKDVGLMTQQGLDDAWSAEAAAAAVTRAARAQLASARTRLAKTVIRAPFDGVVAFRGVNVGDRVESMGSGDAMFEVVDNRVLELTVTVPSTHLATLAAGQRIEFSVDAWPGRAFAGRLTHLNPSVDRQSRAARVVADVPNPDGALKGGLFVKGKIETQSRTAVLQIPRAALLGWDVAAGTADVFVVAGDRTVRRAIRTGAVSDDRVEISQGLASGDQVATRGAFNLREGDRVPVVAAAPGS
jgi:membrane fusion protein, multidrug efflux system